MEEHGWLQSWKNISLELKNTYAKIILLYLKAYNQT